MSERPQKVIIHNTKPNELYFATRAAEDLMENLAKKDTCLMWPTTGYSAYAVRNTKSISVWGHYESTQG